MSRLDYADWICWAAIGVLALVLSFTAMWYET